MSPDLARAGFILMSGPRLVQICQHAEGAHDCAPLRRARCLRRQGTATAAGTPAAASTAPSAARPFTAASVAATVLPLADRPRQGPPRGPPIPLIQSGTWAVAYPVGPLSDSFIRHATTRSQISQARMRTAPARIANVLVAEKPSEPRIQPWAM